MTSSIAILLPFRNAATTLDAAIASIAAQSFHDWQLLLIDNASSDASRSIADAWEKRDARIKVLKEQTVGIAPALNTGIGPSAA